MPFLYPNPCRGDSVTLHIPITATSNVKVQIFITAFRLVRELDLSQEPPQMELVLDSFDQHKNPLANGFYYVALTTSRGRSIVKLLVLR